MVVDYSAACKIIQLVLKNPQGRNTVGSSLQCGLITGISTFGATLLLGPLGTVAGAALGSTVAYATFKDEFKSLLQVFEEDMSEKEKMELMKEVHQFLSQLDISDVFALVSLTQGDQELSGILLAIIKQYIEIWNQNKEKNKY